MFLIKKRLVFGCLTLLSFSMISAQDIIETKEKIHVGYKKLVFNGDIIHLPIYPNNVVVPSKKDILSNTLGIENQKEFTTNWDNQRFNPYLNESLSFPFQLTFNDDDFSSPVTHKMVVTSHYGWRRGRPHQGIDIDLQTGDSVRSILDGKVRYVGYHGGYGNTIIVRHYNGLETVYAHLSKTLVKENDEVKKGNTIGTGGVTGNARGSHLHLEVRYRGKSINPEYLFEFSTETKIRSDVLFVTKKWTTPKLHTSKRKSKIVIHKSIENIALLEEQQKKIYTVKKGDTLHKIANRHGLVVSQICKTNAIQYNTVLKIGQQIIVN